MAKQKLDLDFFEVIMLDNCLSNASYFSSIVDLATPKYFNNLDCRRVYALLSIFHEKRGRLPSDIELRTYLTNDHLKLAFKNLQGSISHFSGNYEDDELIENTETFIKERGFAITLQEVVENYNEIDLQEDSEEILEKFTKVCNVSLTTDLGMDYFEDIEDFVNRMNEDNDHMSTGFPWLDKKLDGGYLSDGKALYVFSGATNAGKSILLGNAATTLLKQNKNVLIITMEMSEDIYAERISAQFSRIPMHNLKSSKETLVQFCNNFKSNNPSANLIIKEFPNNTVKVSGIKTYIDRLQKRKGFKPDAIIIDYLNLIAPKQSTGSLYEEVKGVAEGCRGLSYVFHCPVITATQLGRKAYNKENPGIETVSESYGTSSTADVQISIYSNEDDREIGMVNIGIQKNRYGPNFGTKALKVDWDTLYLEQFEDDDEDSICGEADLLSGVESSLKSLRIE